MEAASCELDSDSHQRIKIILLGDSDVGKSKLVEKFLEGKVSNQVSTRTLTIYQQLMKIESQKVYLDIWDRRTMDNEKFNKLRPSFYDKAQACVFVFDVTKSATYDNLTKWYNELREFTENIPCVCAANKIDLDIQATKKDYELIKKYELSLHFVSACDGTDVVNLFKDVVHRAFNVRKQPTH